jgi:hypothetical protein
MVAAAAGAMKTAAPWVLACGFLLCLAGFPGEFSRRFSSPALPSVSFLLFIMRSVGLHFPRFSNGASVACTVLLRVRQ